MVGTPLIPGDLTQRPDEMTSRGWPSGHGETPPPTKGQSSAHRARGRCHFVFYCTALTFLNYNDTISQMSPKNILNQLINKSIALQDGIYQIHN